MNKFIPVSLILCIFIGGMLIGNSINIAPDNKPVPSPIIKTKDLVVLFIEETEDRSRLSQEQLSIFTSIELREYLDKAKAKYKFFDKDIDLTYEESLWKELMKMPRSGEPWLFISNGKDGYSGPPPSNVYETITLIKKYE